MWEYNPVAGEENSNKTSGKLKQVKNQMVSRRVATTGTRTINAGKKAKTGTTKVRKSKT